MSHFNSVTTKVNGRIVNIPSKRLKDKRENEADAAKTEKKRLKAGGKPRKSYASFDEGVKAAKLKSKKEGGAVRKKRKPTKKVKK